MSFGSDGLQDPVAELGVQQIVPSTWRESRQVPLGYRLVLPFEVPSTQNLTMTSTRPVLQLLLSTEKRVIAIKALVSNFWSQTIKFFGF